MASFKKLQNWLNSNPYFSAETSLFCQLAKLWWLLFSGTSWKVCKKLDFSWKLLHFWNFLPGVFAWTPYFVCDFMKKWKTLFRADSGRPRRHKVLLWGANLAQICLLSIGKTRNVFLRKSRQIGCSLEFWKKCWFC